MSHEKKGAFSMLNIALFAACFVFTLTLDASADKRKVYGPAKKRIKFGVVLNNDEYTIYRSAALGKGGLKTLHKHLKKNGLPFPKTIIYMNKNGYKFPFYFALDEYFASETQKYGGFKFYHSFGEERTYLDGINPYEPRDDIDRKSILGSRARKYFRLRDDGVDGGMDSLMRIMDLVLSPENQPVLFHCFGGRHRTGIVAMIIRYLQGGWWTDGTYKRRRGIDMNPAQYEYYKYNHLLFRKSNIEFVERFSQDDRFELLNEKYGESIRR